MFLGVKGSGISEEGGASVRVLFVVGGGLGGGEMSWASSCAGLVPMPFMAVEACRGSVWVVPVSSGPSVDWD